MYNLKRSTVIGVFAAAVFLMGASNEHDTKPPKTPAKPGEEKNSMNAVDKTVQAAPSSAKTQGMLIYKPPLRGAPAGRIGGGTRGATERESFSLQVLAPDHVGLTVSDQPSLYWYISKATTYPIELTIIERNAVKPLVEKVIRSPYTGGIQTASLVEYGVRLRRNVLYKWFVTLVTAPQQRSKDILAGGIISAIDPPPALAAKLKAADNSRRPYIYAEEGLWYDALEAISEMIDTSPNDSDIHKQRAALLEQVGLSEAAAFENKQ